MLWKVIASIFWQYKKEHLFYVFLNIIFIIATIVNNVYLPQIYGKLYDMFQKDMSTFMYAFAFILILKSVIYLIYQFEEYYFSIQRLGVEDLTQKYVIDKIREKYIINPDDIIIGEKLSTIFKIQHTFSGWYSKIFQYLIQYIFVIGSSAVYMWTLDKYLPLYLIILLAGSFLAIFTNISFCAKECYNANNQYLKLYNIIEDYLSNLLTIHTYNEYKNENQKLADQSKKYQEGVKDIEKCSLVGHLIGVAIVIIFMFLSMYRCYKLVINNTIKKSQFMSVYFIIITLLGSLIYLSDMFHDLTIEYHNLYNIEKISDLNLFSDDTSKANDNDNIKYKKIKTDSLIKIVELDYKYNGTDHSIIQNLNLDIKKGERVALIGNIGAGKSTIIKLILGLINPTSGDIFFNGYNYKTLKQSDLFKKFGYMTQNPILFNRSILDNILFSNPDTSRKDIEDKLELFGLNEVFNKLEKGIDSDVGKNGSKLSGGQRQIIWFLRIYFHNPDILLLDEPTASLSKESKELLWNLIDKGFKGKTIIMSSHDDFLIKLATRKVKIGA
jgi:ABC-type bacteriocin/lantibiotic exporter with double-glycine peptidase domain